MSGAEHIKGATIAGWFREGGRWRLYLVHGVDLIPIHVTSIRNGRVAGHNCWTEHCANNRDEFITGMWPEHVQIGRRYVVDTWGLAVYERPWRCHRCGGERGPCRMTIWERSGFALGKPSAKCDDGAPVPVRLRWVGDGTFAR